MDRFVTLVLWAYRTLNALSCRPHISFSLIGQGNGPCRSDGPLGAFGARKQDLGLTRPYYQNIEALKERRHSVENKYYLSRSKPARPIRSE